MNWKEIQLSADRKHFIYRGQQPLYEVYFLRAENFTDPGVAAVSDDSGWFHIDYHGKALYEPRFRRVFPFYQLRAAAVMPEGWFHIDISGRPVYDHRFAWCGNFVGGVAVVRELNGFYKYINGNGDDGSKGRYLFAKDFAEGMAAVMLAPGRWFHIKPNGKEAYEAEYLDLGSFYNGFAPAKDEEGWFHINPEGEPVYDTRFEKVGDFVNGVCLGEDKAGQKLMITEDGSYFPLGLVE